MLKAKYAVLREILLDLGFEIQADDKRVRFNYPNTKTWFLFRPYKDEDQVDPADLVGVRYQLDWWGFLPRERFEEILREKQLAS